MSATLKSFDLEDERSIAFRKTQSPSLRNLGKRDQINSDSHEKVYYDDDIEFDDTRMDITDTLRPGKSYKNKNLSDNRKGGLDSFQQHDYIIKNITTKVPLKDSLHSNSISKISRNSKAATPDMLDRIYKYRSKNGTPLKLPPLNSNQFSLDSDNDINKLPIEENIEDSLIKHRKLISDDNKFSPGISRDSVKNYSRNVSNGHMFTSPTKTTNKPPNETTITPPSNLKVRPFIFQSGSRLLPSHSHLKKGLPLEYGNQHVSTSVHDGDIEFDSSDVDDDGITEKRPLPILRKSHGPLSDPLSKSNVLSQHNTNMRNNNREHDDRLNEPSIYEQHKLRTSGTQTVFQSKLESIQNTVNKDNQNEKYGDISRAEILEKINNTINSLMEKDKIESSPSKMNVENILPENILPENILPENILPETILPEIILPENILPENTGNEMEQADSSEESPEEIMNELDSFFTGNKSNPGHQKSPDVSQRSPSKFAFGKNEPSSIQKERKSKATPIRTHYSRLSGKYARQILHRRKSEKFSNKPYLDIASSHDSINDLPDTEWPTSKWLKLNKVLQLEDLTKKDIIHSEVLLHKLGCTSKNELKQRVEFLIQFNEMRKTNNLTRKTINKVKKNNLALKSSKSEKKFQIL